MSNQVISSDSGTVVIQINPQVVQESDKKGTYHNAVLKSFLKVQPKSLGSVQIMIGVTILLFGIVLTINFRNDNITVFTGITYWGSLIYISAGSLSVAAENKLHSCVVKASLGMNVLTAITATIAIILMSIHKVILSGRNCDYNYEACLAKQGIVGILLVFNIFQFIVSICISAFACKATCNTDSTVVNVSLNQVFEARNVSTKQTTTTKEKLAERKENT